MGLLKADQLRNAAGTGNTDFYRQWASKSTLLLNMGAATILASNNVASVTDGGAGTFTKNLTNAMSSSNFSTTCGGYPNGYTDNDFAWQSTASSALLRHSDGVSVYADVPSFSSLIHGSLA